MVGIGGKVGEGEGKVTKEAKDVNLVTDSAKARPRARQQSRARWCG